MRQFSQVVTIPPGKIWPDSDGSLPLANYRYFYVQNRAAPGSGNDLWLGFTGRPSAASPTSADELVAAGTSLSKNLAGETDENGDAQASHYLWILNVGTAPVTALVELDQEEIKVSNNAVVGSSGAAVAGTQTPGDGIATPTDAVDVRSFLEWVTGTGAWTMGRAPSVFKTITTAALGATNIWTPAAGKRFRLLRYLLIVTGNASLAAAGIVEATLLDNGVATGLGDSIAFGGTAQNAVANNVVREFIDLGPVGYLSAAANNPLQLNLSAALASGEFRIVAMGTEE